MQHLMTLISEYGLWIVFFGMIFEGTTVIILSGVLCHMGVLGCKETFVVAILGAAVGDQMWYFLGKYYGQKVLARFPSLDKKLAKFQNSLTNKADILALSSRFIYGGAVVFPLGLGINNYLHKRFTLLDTIGVSFASFAGLLLGYILSDSFERVLGDVSRVEHLMLFIIIVVAAFKIYKYRKNKLL